jgi:hypothetical protein
MTTLSFVSCRSGALGARRPVRRRASRARPQAWRTVRA